MVYGHRFQKKLEIVKWKLRDRHIDCPNSKRFHCRFRVLSWAPDHPDVHTLRATRRMGVQRRQVQENHLLVCGGDGSEKVAEAERESKTERHVLMGLQV